LAIDTATETASIALYQADEVHSEHTWRSLGNHTVELVPHIARLLQQQKLTPRELSGVVVALGPGSFTGLRIGVSVAKGLAFAAKIPMVGIPTLDVVAYAHSNQSLPICAVIQAGRGRLCTALYLGRAWPLRRLTDVRLIAAADLGADVRQPTLFCGEVDSSTAESLRARLGELAFIASPAFTLRRAGFLAELGWRRLQRGESDAPATLTPIYLYHPPIS
jgi:tRNA threonylcarbamoyladenosine biosynthesis protein TsaB